MPAGNGTGARAYILDGLTRLWFASCMLRARPNRVGNEIETTKQVPPGSRARCASSFASTDRMRTSRWSIGCRKYDPKHRGKPRPTPGFDLLQIRRLPRESSPQFPDCPLARRIEVLSVRLPADTSSDGSLLFFYATVFYSYRLRATAGLGMKEHELDESLGKEHTVERVRRKTAAYSDGFDSDAPSS